MTETRDTVVLDALFRLRSFTGSPREFWQELLRIILSLTGGIDSLVLVKDLSAADAAWKPMARENASADAGSRFSLPLEHVNTLAEECRCAGGVVTFGAFSGQGAVACGLRTHQDNISCMALVLLKSAPDTVTRARPEALRLLADTPVHYERHKALAISAGRVDHFSFVLELLAQLHDERQFRVASMTVVNELCRKFGASMVCVAWLHKRYLRMAAMSNMDRFNAKAEDVVRLEKTIEECLDQDNEIVVPAPAGGGAVAREHENLGRQLGISALLSVPLRLDDKVVGALHLQRASGEFSDEEVRGLRVIGDQVTPWLAGIRARDRWFGGRAVAWFSDAARRTLRMEHVWTKLGVATALAAIVFMLVYKTEYRVEASFMLKSHEQAFLSAPYRGYIASVHADVGDSVDVGVPMLNLDEAQLAVREAGLRADIARNRAEERKARGTGELAQMQMSAARAQQAEAELALTLLQRSQARLVAPFAGIVVEGRHRERIGALVEEGDVLFRIARIAQLYAELDVDERDIQDIACGMSGEIALQSRPGEPQSMQIIRIESSAVPKEAKNVFLVRATTASQQDWWRPGMTGIAKVNAGKRSLWWIFTHRIVDWVRLRLWW